MKFSFEKNFSWSDATCEVIFLQSDDMELVFLSFFSNQFQRVELSDEADGFC